jgi:hypothetical protein
MFRAGSARIGLRFGQLTKPRVRFNEIKSRFEIGRFSGREILAVSMTETYC